FLSGAVRYEIKRVGSLARDQSSATLQAMDSDSYNAQSVVPCLHDFMIDPLAICSFSTDEHDIARLALHLPRNPTLDFLVFIGTTRDRFPLIIRSRLVALDTTN